VLGVSLSKVQARYFRDSDAGRDLVEEQNFRDVIENYAWSRRYKTEDIDRVPYAVYDSNIWRHQISGIRCP
jgi:hypothetical protein